MNTTIERSDLHEWAHHEHAHLDKLFDDLRATFNAIATGELVGEAREEALGEALEDLRMALEEMLEHFSEEEEVYFLAIEQRFVDMTPKLDQLAQAHELICERTRKLKRHLATEDVGKETSAYLIALVNELALAIERHNEQEQMVFKEALARMSDDERIEVLREKRHFAG